jgi:hypothetical protein
VKPGASKFVRCAIYTRVSTDQGLEQDFNSSPNAWDEPLAKRNRHIGLPETHVFGDRIHSLLVNVTANK